MTHTKIHHAINNKRNDKLFAEHLWENKPLNHTGSELKIMRYNKNII